MDVEHDARWWVMGKNGGLWGKMVVYGEKMVDYVRKWDISYEIGSNYSHQNGKEWIFFFYWWRVMFIVLMALFS
jgi:hypothetical protein